MSLDIPRLDGTFAVVNDFTPSGDQPAAIAELTSRVKRGDRHVVLLGATGTGKSATTAWLVEKLQRPTLVIVVLADETVRLDRLVRFRGMTEETARARFAAQATDEQRRAVADIVIENDGTPAELRAVVDAVWERLVHERAARGGR